MTDPTGAASVLPPPGESAELRRLRAQVAELESKLATTSTERPKPRSRERWRSVAATALITIGCLLAPIAVVAVWASDQISDTDRYVETVAPLADDPAVQAAVTDDITEQVFEYVDVQALTQQALAALNQQGVSSQVTGQLDALSAPLANAVENFVHDRIATIVESDRFAAAWDRANAAAHEQLVNLLEGEPTGAITAENDAVAVNLGPFVAQVKDELVAQGFTVASRIPAVEASFTIMQSDSIGKAQNGYRLLNALGRWLPAIALLFIALGVYVAKGHRRALVGAGLGVVAGMLALGTVLAVTRPLYLDAVPEEALTPDAAAAVFDTLVRFLRQALRAVGVAFLIIAAVAFLSGSSVTAVRTRAALTNGIGGLRGGAESAGLRTGRFGTWVYANKRALRIAAMVAGAVALTFWTHPTVTVVIGVAVAVLVAIALIEFLGRPPAVAVEGAPVMPRQSGAGVESTEGVRRSEPVGGPARH